MTVLIMQPLAIIIVVLLCLSLVYPSNCDDGLEMIAVFKGYHTEVPYEEDNGSITIRKPRYFRIPALVGGMLNDTEFLAVICDARYDSYRDWGFIEPAVKTSYGDYKTWSPADIFVKNTRKSPIFSVVGDITAVMKGNKIFVLAPSWDISQFVWFRHPPYTGWNILMVVGTVVNSSESDSGDPSIKWERKKSLKDILPKTVLGAEAYQFVGGVGNGVVTKSGTIVFPIQLSNENRRVVSSIMYSRNDGSTWHIGETTEDGASECSVVEWGKEKFLLTTRYDSGYRKVYESNDMGATWEESLMFSRVWGNDPKRKGVGCQGSAITAPVDGEDVLFFSHPLNRKGDYIRDTLQLWMSDGLRIVCVGTISERGKGERSGYSILAHVGGSLYLTHEINPFPFRDSLELDARLQKWDRVIALSPLRQFFESAKKTVRAWRQHNVDLQAKGIETKGLVGYLGNSNSDTMWEDMYNCVNATVKGGKRVNGGFQFNGEPESGARWPVASQGQNQVYIFTAKQFTLAATVIIHAADGTTEVSLLGASAVSQGSAVLLDLGYTQKKKWYVVHGNGERITTENLMDQGEEYHVALTFANGAAFVYVDGVDIVNEELKITQTASISHFYMGGTGQSSSTPTGSSCIVKNVMLFNRALQQNEVAELAKVTKDKKLQEEITTTKLNRKSERDTKVPTKQSGSDGEKKDSSVIKKWANNGSVMSLSFIAWICLVCSVVMLSVL